MKKYFTENQNTNLDSYNEGKTSIRAKIEPEKNEDISDTLDQMYLNEEKDLIVQILNSISPKGHIDIIHSPVLTYDELRITKLQSHELFFITKNEDKTNFFVYSFSGNVRLQRKIYPEKIEELNQDDFFLKIAQQPELKILHDSFFNSLNSLNLQSNLNISLENKNVQKISKKI